jgi:hypothetical protein
VRPDLWVLELGLAPTHPSSDPEDARGYVRVSPRDLLERCERRIGLPRVTADGPILPALHFADLPLVSG